MSPDEIDSILRIQWRSLHTGPRYVEDFYAQAVVEKGGWGVNARTFAPDALRELAPAEKGVADLPSFARLDGLGKIPFSNVRRPKPLMDLGFGGAAPAPAPTPADDDKNGDASTPAPKRLDQEPRLAARVVLEEAACLLLDVDDIDRLWASSGGARGDEGSLRQRRAILMEALCRSLRLADAPTCDRVRDGVFLRLMALHKGRAVLARGLRLLAAPLAALGPGAAGIKASRPLKLVWAALRCADDLFAERDVGAAEEGVATTPADTAAAADAAREAHVTAVAAAAAADALRRLRSPEEARDCVAALARGSLAARARAPLKRPPSRCCPSSPPARARPPPFPAPGWRRPSSPCSRGRGSWGSGRGACQPRSATVPSPPPPSDAVRAAWEAAAGEFATLLAGHVGTLADVAALAREAGSADAVAYARAVAPTHVVAAVLPHAGDVAAATLRRRLAELQEGG